MSMGLLFGEGGSLDTHPPPTAAGRGRAASFSGNQAGAWQRGSVFLDRFMEWCAGVNVEDVPVDVAVAMIEKLARMKNAVEGLRLGLAAHVDRVSNPQLPAVPAGQEPPGGTGSGKGRPLPGDQPDLTGLLQSSGGQSRNGARDEVRRAQTIRDVYPLFGAEIRRGTLSSTYVDVLSQRIPPELTEQSKIDEAALLMHAKQETVDQFTKTVRTWVVQHAPERAERKAKEAARAEKFAVFPAEGGYKLAGWLDALNGLQLDKSLRALVGVPAEGDRRSHAQRYADALTDLVARRPELPSGSGAVLGGSVRGNSGRAGGAGQFGGTAGAGPEVDVSGPDIDDAEAWGVGTGAGGAGHWATGASDQTECPSEQTETLGKGLSPGPLANPDVVRRVPRAQVMVHVPLSTLVQTEKAIEKGCLHLDGGGGSSRDHPAGGHPEVRPPRNSKDPRGGSPPSCHLSGQGLGLRGECLDSREEVTEQLGRVVSRIRAGVTSEMLSGFEPAELEDGSPLAPSQLATLLCDSALSRIVLTAYGEPLDASKAQRTFSATQAKAVLTRDRTCRYPGCDRGMEVGEIHHAQQWHEKGATVIDNAVLLCFRHHRAVHANGITITHHVGGFVFTRRDGTVLGVRHHESNRARAHHGQESNGTHSGHGQESNRARAHHGEEGNKARTRHGEESNKAHSRQQRRGS